MPNNLLELSLEQVRAVVAGYSDRLVDAEIAAVMTGYYSAYYTNTKRPKKPQKLIEAIMRAHRKKDSSKRTPAEAPDIEEFMRREARRLSQTR